MWSLWWPHVQLSHNYNKTILQLKKKFMTKFDFSIQFQNNYRLNINLKIHPFLFALKPFVTSRTSIQLQVDES